MQKWAVKVEFSKCFPYTLHVHVIIANGTMECLSSLLECRYGPKKLRKRLKLV